MAERFLNTSAATLGPAWSLRYNDGEHCIAWIDNAQLILSRQAPSMNVMKRIIAELDDLAAHCGRGTGALLVIRSDVAPPSEEARKYIQTELSRSAMLAAAQVVEGTGFRGAAMRSVLSVMQLAARPRYPMKVFSDVDTASQWLALELRKRGGAAPEPGTLSDAVGEIRDLFIQNTLPPRSGARPLKP